MRSARPMLELVIAAGLKLMSFQIDSPWMRRSLAIGSRARASHASRARTGRSRQRQSKWAGSTRRCTKTALVTAPFPIRHDPAATRAPAVDHQRKDNRGLQRVVERTARPDFPPSRGNSRSNIRREIEPRHAAHGKIQRDENGNHRQKRWHARVVAPD